MEPSTCNNCSSSAVSLCEDCPSMLCTGCLNNHAQVTSFSSHRLMDLSMQPEQGDVIHYVMCQPHKVPTNYYCHDCSKGMCQLCVPQSHKNHQVEPLSSLVETKRAVLKKAVGDIHDMVEELDSKSGEPCKLQAEAESTIAVAESDFQLQVTQCTATVLDWQDRNKAHLENRKLELLKEVDMLLSRQNSHQVRMKSLEDDINTLMSRNKPLELIEKTVNIMKEVELLKGKSVDIQQSMFVKGVKFIPSSLPETMGDLQDLNIGSGSNQEELTFWSKAGRGSGLGELLSPCDVLLLPGGDLLLADWGNGRVQRFLPSGDMPAVLLQDVNPERLAAVGGDLLMLTDDKRRAVLSFTMTGKIVREWQPPEVIRPWGLSVNRDSSRVVTDYAKSTAFVYSADEICTARFGGYGGCGASEPWLLNLPTYVCCDSHGRILISDCNNHAIKIFDANGIFLSAFGSRGTDDGQLRYPRGLCVDSLNNVVIADWGNDRICQFSPDGQFIRNIFSKKDSDQFGWPYGLSYLSGTFNNDRPRLAITTEGPDALLIIPYHCTNDQFPKGLPNNIQYEEMSQRTNGIHHRVDQNGIILNDTYVQWESGTESDSEPTASGRPNRRRNAHGSGTGNSWTENLQSPSSAIHTSRASGNESSLISMSRDTSTIRDAPTDSTGNRASQESRNEEFLEKVSDPSESTSGTKSNSPGSELLEINKEFPDLQNTSYIPSTTDSRQDQMNKALSARDKNNEKSMKEQILYKKSLDSIPEGSSPISAGVALDEK